MSPFKIEKTNRIVEFRGPGDAEWRSLAPGGDDIDGSSQVTAHGGQLKDALRASLQMQHLVALAGSGCSLSAGGPSMLDLWNDAVGERPSDAAVKVAARIHHHITDKNIEALLSRAEAFLQVQEDDDIARFVNASKRRIIDRCTGFAEKKDLRGHVTFLHRLSRRRVRDQRLKLFTTNYDLCFEQAAQELASVALDGFSFAFPRVYDPRFFSYDIVRRPRNGDDPGHYLEGVFLLYKLHGSVNWARKDSRICEEERPDPEEACLIYPAFGKYQQSFTQPHLEAMAAYLSAVREPNTCVLAAGFGFNDDHLSEPLLSAVSSNPHLRLIVVDQEARTKATGGNGYWSRLSELSLSGEDVWIISAAFEEFATMIPDLKSLTPGENLAKVIQRLQ